MKGEEGPAADGAAGAGGAAPGAMNPGLATSPGAAAGVPRMMGTGGAAHPSFTSRKSANPSPCLWEHRLTIFS